MKWLLGGILVVLVFLAIAATRIFVLLHEMYKVLVLSLPNPKAEVYRQQLEQELEDEAKKR